MEGWLDPLICYRLPGYSMAPILAPGMMVRGCLCRVTVTTIRMLENLKAEIDSTYG